MKRSVRLLFAAGIAVLALALGLALAACGGDGDDGDDGNGTAPTTTAGETPGETPGEIVRTYSTEWAITGEDGADIPGVAAGEVTFEAHNDGQIAHELAVIKTDLDPAELPRSGGIVNEDEAGELIGRTAYISGADSEALTVTLEAGNYVLLCNIPAHYEQGTFAPLVVE